MHHAKFNIYHIYIVRENHNVKSFCHARQSLSRANADHLTDSGVFTWVKDHSLRSCGVSQHTCLTSCWKSRSPNRWCSLTFFVCQMCSRCLWWASTYTTHKEDKMNTWLSLCARYSRCHWWASTYTTHKKDKNEHTTFFVCQMYSRSLWWGSTYTTHGEDKNEYMIFVCVPDVFWVSLGGPVPTQYTKKTKIITWLKLCARCVLGSWRASPHSTQRIHNQFVMNTWICMPDMFCFCFLMGQHTQHTQMHDFLWAQNVS